MKYTRAFLRGHDRISEKYIAEVLHIPIKKKKKHAKMRFRIKRKGLKRK